MVYLKPSATENVKRKKLSSVDDSRDQILPSVAASFMIKGKTVFQEDGKYVTVSLWVHRL